MKVLVADDDLVVRRMLETETPPADLSYLLAVRPGKSTKKANHGQKD